MNNIPQWSDAPPWAAFLYRDAYGSWTWSDDFPDPEVKQVVTEREFQHPTLTKYDVSSTVQKRPGGQDDLQ